VKFMSAMGKRVMSGLKPPTHKRQVR
jgi:hypothetical protein